MTLLDRELGSYCIQIHVAALNVTRFTDVWEIKEVWCVLDTHSSGVDARVKRGVEQELRK